MFTWKRASRHNGVHLFDIATPKRARELKCVVHFDLKCASHHNGVQLFISHLTTSLRTSRFSEPTCRPSGATNHWKNTVFRDFPTFSRTWIFFLRRLSLFDLLSSSLLFSDSSHLCFSSVHIVGSLTSKLPSIINLFRSNSKLPNMFHQFLDTRLWKPLKNRKPTVEICRVSLERKLCACCGACDVN